MKELHTYDIIKWKWGIIVKKLDESNIDELIKLIAERAQKESQRTQIVNPYRVKEFTESYNEIKEIIKLNKYKVEYLMYQPYTSMGAISIIGKDVNIYNTEVFSKACCRASNIDIYKLSDGNIKIDLTFHGLTKSLEDE